MKNDHGDAMKKQKIGKITMSTNRILYCMTAVALFAGCGKTSTQESNKSPEKSPQKTEQRSEKKNADAEKKAAEYRAAAEKGDAEAQCKLGLCYHEGYGVPKDYRQAAHWFRKAAEQGMKEAQCLLGLCYEDGDGVPKDYKQAAYWFRKAAEQGDADAQFKLGKCYHDGNGVEKDCKQAAHWFRKAAEQGDARAQGFLGAYYFFGNGVEQDYKQAICWFRKSAEQGYANAQFTLGACYFYGKGVPKDYKQAAYWFRKAAEQGDADAQFKLGGCYFFGYGVEKDYKQAICWSRKAAAQGHAKAQLFLDRFRLGVEINLEDAEKLPQGRRVRTADAAKPLTRNDAWLKLRKEGVFGIKFGTTFHDRRKKGEWEDLGKALDELRERDGLAVIDLKETGFSYNNGGFADSVFISVTPKTHKIYRITGTVKSDSAEATARKLKAMLERKYDMTMRRKLFCDYVFSNGEFSIAIGFTPGVEVSITYTDLHLERLARREREQQAQDEVKNIDENAL